eukprot:s927_g12.t1
MKSVYRVFIRSSSGHMFEMCHELCQQRQLPACLSRPGSRASSSWVPHLAPLGPRLQKELAAGRLSVQSVSRPGAAARQIGLSTIADYVSTALALARKGNEDDACVCARKRKVFLLSEVIPSDQDEAFQVDAGCQTDADIMADLQEYFLATLGQLQLKIGEYEEMVQVMTQQLLPRHGSSNASKPELQTQSNEQAGHCVDGYDDMASPKGLVQVKPDDRDDIETFKEQQREAKRVAR